MSETQFNGDLILLRGLPGSGKSTLGEVILSGAYVDKHDVISADDYFMDDEGVYRFDPSKLKEAHNQSQQRCAEKMRNKFLKIVIANTFTEEWEMEIYFEMAERYGDRVHSVVVENRHNNKSIHSVPQEKMKQMSERFQIKI